MAWYRASSGPPGTLKGPVLAQSAPFGGPRGPRRAPRDQIWSQLPLIGLTGLELWLPHTLAWYLAFSGPPETPKGPVLGISFPFGGSRGPQKATGDQIWSQLPLIGLTGLESWLQHTLARYRASSGPPNGPVLALSAPFGPKRAQCGTKIHLIFEYRHVGCPDRRNGIL